MSKKTIAGLISILLVSVIVITAFTPAFAASKGTEPNATDKLTSQKEIDRNSYYSTMAAALKETFPKITIKDEAENYEFQDFAYPPEYAGAYIDEANNLHIILSKNANMVTKDNYQVIMGNDPDVIYEYVEFPLSTLYEIQRSMFSYMKDFRIECLKVDEINNKVEISLLDNTQEKQITDYLNAKFDNFNSRCVTFTGPIGLKLTAADTASNALAGGNVSNAFELSTFGFNAYKHSTGQAGVVVAGHCTPVDANNYNIFGTLVGSANVNNRCFWGDVDAAFIPFSASITASYKMHAFSSPDDCITHYYPSASYTLGESMTKHGATSGTNTGTVTALSVGVYYDDYGVSIYDQVQITNTQALGDSGGPVFHTEVVNPGTDLHILAGIAVSMDGSGQAYVTKIHNINSQFGITPFYGV
jgi:hypothetical protein